MRNEEPGFWRSFGGAALVVVGILFIIAIGMVLGPQWRVYSERLEGNAELQRAEFNRRVVVVQAEAEMDAAVSKKQAAITRAEGIAAANKIIGESLSPEYIQWLWVDGLNEGNNQNQIIYVPNSGLLPVFNYNERSTHVQR